MDSKKQIEIINNYLEESYIGARMMDDAVCMLKISRAIAALNADIEDDIFTEEFIKKAYQ